MTVETILPALISGAFAIIISMLSSHLKYKSEIKKVHEQIALSLLESKENAERIAKQMGIGFIYWEGCGGVIKEKIFIPPAGRIHLGRGENNDLWLRDDITVSREHAAIRVTEGTPYLENLAATNGTILNGINIDQPAQLNHLDRISIGEQTVVFHKLH